MTEPAAWDEGKPRIITLTMNPALDITTSVDVVRPTEKMRCGAPRYDPGGGGINVARIVHVLGGCSTPGRRVDREPADGAAR